MKVSLISIVRFLSVVSALACGVLLFTFSTLAAPNEQINYQGKLTDTSGAAVSDGDYEIIFTLYTSDTGPTSVWTETATITTQNGLFSIMMGSSTDFTGVDWDQTLYLGVEIDGDGEMSPRKVLGIVPAAFTAVNLGDASSTQYLRSDQPDTMSSTSLSTLLTVIQSGAGDILNLFDDTTEVFTVLDGGNVGIGTSTPSANLTINGTTGQNLFQIATSTNQNILVVNENGNVGIGTSSPKASLQIGTYGSLYTSTAAGNFDLSYNSYYDDNAAAWKYIADGPATLMEYQQPGSQNAAFYAAADGSEDGTISWTKMFGLLSTGVFAPGKITAGNNGLGASTLSANGNLSIGASYYNVNAPTSGAIIQGNVGIGTTSPHVKLTVGGNSFLGGDLTATGTVTVGDFASDALLVIGGQNSSASGATLSFQENTSGGNGINLVYDSTDNQLEFYDDAGNSNRMILFRDTGNLNLISGVLQVDGTGDSRIMGNLGVGTTSPHTQLTVAGHAFLGGNVTATGTLTVTDTGTSTFTGGIEAAALNITGSATSTFAQGIDLADGCFAVNGTCLGGGSSLFSENGQTTYLASSTSLLSVGTTSPLGRLAVTTDGANTTWRKVGNSSASLSNGNSAVAALSATRVAYFDSTQDDLRTYEFDGFNWSQVGIDTNFGVAGTAALAALAPNRIAFFDTTNELLILLEFSGNSWSIVGSMLSISGSGSPSLAALSSNRVAFVDTDHDELRTYEFDGSAWSQVGNSLGVGSFVTVAIEELGPNRVAFMDTSNDDLRVYEFDGTDWLQVGTDTNLSGVSANSIAALSPNRIALSDSSADTLQVYEFNGSVWSTVGSSITLTGNNRWITALTPNRVATVEFSGTLETYQFGNPLLFAGNTEQQPYFSVSDTGMITFSGPVATTTASGINFGTNRYLTLTNDHSSLSNTRALYSLESVFYEGVGFGMDANIYGGELTNSLTVGSGIQIASATPATTTYSLYNQEGTLYWNGSAVGSGSSLFSESGQTTYLASSTSLLSVGTTTPLGRLAVTTDGVNTDWKQIGNDLNISGTFLGSVAALSPNRIAYIDDVNEDLRTYEFNGFSWVQVGNDLNISGVSTVYIAALAPNRIAFFDDAVEDLRVYEFDGNTWSQVGNDLNISSVGASTLTALSPNRVAFYDVTSTNLRTYEFDGTDWSQVGSALTVSGGGNASLAGLTQNRVAFIDASNDDLRVYEFNGTTWSQVGSDLNITSTALLPALTALSSNRVAYIDDNNADLRVYEFDGDTWSQVGSDLNIAGAGFNTITALSPNRVAFYDGGNEDLRVYQFGNPLFFAGNTEQQPYFSVSDTGMITFSGPAATTTSSGINFGAQRYLTITNADGNDDTIRALYGLESVFSEKVGIGTSTPTANLVINGTTGKNLFQIATATNQDILIVDQDGKVGIGTSTPSAQLALSDLLYVGGTGTSTFENNLEVLGALKVGSASLYLDSTSIQNESGDLVLQNNTSNVGVGTTTANAKLTVYGDIFAEGSDRYLNFGAATGTSGYGFRDNSGAIEFRDSTGSWISLSSLATDVGVTTNTFTATSTWNALTSLGGSTTVQVLMDASDLTLGALKLVVDGVETSTIAPAGTKTFRVVEATSSVQVTAADYGFDISTGSYSQATSVTDYEFAPTAIEFSNDGTKLFVAGSTDDEVDEFDLSTAFDISTALYVQSKSISNEDIDVTGLEFNADGSKMFIVGQESNTVYEYNLSTEYDVSTASVGNSFSVNGQETEPTDLEFSPDGTRMFIIGTFGEDVNEYRLSTAFDITTAVFETAFPQSNDTFITGIGFSAEGLSMYIVGLDNDSVYQYRLQEPYSVAGASFQRSFSITADTSDPRSIEFNADGSKMFFADPTPDDIYEYDISYSYTGSASAAVATDATNVLSIWTQSGSNISYTTGNVGIGSSTPWRTLSVAGSMAVTGLSAVAGTDQSVCVDPTTGEITTQSGDTCAVSSARFKHDIESLNNTASSGLEMLRAFQPVSFVYNEDTSSTTYWGFIAEEMASTSPQLAAYNADGIVQTINHVAITAAVTQAMKELDLNLSTIASTAATTTAQSRFFAEQFFTHIYEKIAQWLADTTNNIGDIFANRFTAREEICVDDQCLSKEDVRRLLELVTTDSASSSESESVTGTSVHSDVEVEPVTDLTVESEIDLSVSSSSATSTAASSTVTSETEGEVSTSTPAVEEILDEVSTDSESAPEEEVVVSEEDVIAVSPQTVTESNDGPEEEEVIEDLESPTPPELTEPELP